MTSQDLIEQMMSLEFSEMFGTVQDHSSFNVEADCELLRKAMKGLGTDEKAIIEVTANRSLKQRLGIVVQYKQMYGRDLKSDLKSELSGHFEDLVLALYTPIPVYQAKCLHNAVSGLGTKENVLIQILASASNEQIKAIREAYKKEYKNELEKDVIGDTSGDFKHFLVALTNAARDESSDVDLDRAGIDAEALYKAGEKKLGTDEATFVRILCSRSYPQLRATFRAYKELVKKDIVKSIKSEFSGHIEDALLAVVQNARCPPAYFAQLLHHSMKGAGTNEALLTRVVVCRSEVDMKQIKEAFVNLYKKTVEEYIKDDTSGDYKKLLLAIVAA